MKKIILLLTVISFSQVFSQIEISTGMGVNYAANPSIKDYINSNFDSGKGLLKTFSTQVEFYGEGVYSISKHFELGIDYGMSIYSFTNTTNINYELSYTVYKPSLVAYYVIPGKGYKFRFGGGMGLRMVSLDEKIWTTVNYSGNGFGFLARAEGHTSLGGNFYAMIAADMRYDIISKVSNGTSVLTSNKNRIFAGNSQSDFDSVGTKVNINTFSVGIKLGISYFF